MCKGYLLASTALQVAAGLSLSAGEMAEAGCESASSVGRYLARPPSPVMAVQRLEQDATQLSLQSDGLAAG